MEPRETILASAVVVRTTEGRVDMPREAWREELAGAESGACITGGLPRNLGDLVVSAHESREGHPLEQPRPGGPFIPAISSVAITTTQSRASVDRSRA